MAGRNTGLTLGVDLRHGVALIYLGNQKRSLTDVPLSRRARNFLQMMPVNLHGNVFDYTASGFKMPGE